MQKYETVDDFLNGLDPAKRAQVDMLRELILAVEPRLQEHIKWNAPSYVLDGEDRITLNLMNKQGVVKLVLHMGATRKENKQGAPIMPGFADLIEWSSDIRGVLSFTSPEDINAKLPFLKSILKNWLAISPNAR